MSIFENKAVLYTYDGYAMAVRDGYALSSGAAGFLAIGTDGTSGRVIRTNQSGASIGMDIRSAISEGVVSGTNGFFSV